MNTYVHQKTCTRTFIATLLRTNIHQQDRYIVKHLQNRILSNNENEQTAITYNNKDKSHNVKQNKSYTNT